MITKRHICIYRKWLNNEITLKEIVDEFQYSSPNSAYTILAKCAKYEHQNNS